MKLITKLRRKRLEEKKRALYVRLPHVIRDDAEVAKLFTGNFRVNVPRQSTKYCYVIFSDVEEKMKNLKAVRNIEINGKRVIVGHAITKLQKNTKPKKKKKIVIPEIKDDVKVTKTLYISNIKRGTKAQEIKAAIPECVTVKMLEPYSEKCRAAKVKMESAQAAAEYLLRIKERPIVGGRRLRINPNTTVKHRRKKPQSLKIYDGETEIKAEPKQRKPPQKSIMGLDHIVLENKT